MDPLYTAIKDKLLPERGVRKLEDWRPLDTIYPEEDSSKYVYFIESGLAKSTNPRFESHGNCCDLLCPGDLFGIETLTGDESDSNEVVMITEGSVYRIPKARFLGFCGANRHSWRWFAELLLRHQRRASLRMRVFAHTDVKHRIVEILPFLMEQGATLEPDRKKEAYVLSIRQEDLAVLVGAARETTSTALNNLERDNYIKLGRGRIVCTPEQLTALRQSHL